MNAGEGAKAAAIAPVPAPIPPDTEVLKAYATSGEPARTADKSPEASPDIRSTEPAVGALKPADPIPVEAKPSDPASTDKPAVN